jgi:sporulation protein YlmC with PRC-barrel domain
MGDISHNRLQAWMPMSDLDGKRDFNFTDIRGFKIMNTTGHPVGTAKEVFVDPNTLEPGFAFLSYERFMNSNTKHYLVPWDELRIGEGYVQTRWTEEHLLPETLQEQRANLPDSGAPPASMADGSMVNSAMVSGAIAGSPPFAPSLAAHDVTADEEEDLLPSARA